MAFRVYFKTGIFYQPSSKYSFKFYSNHKTHSQLSALVQTTNLNICNSIIFVSRRVVHGQRQQRKEARRLNNN
jgi:hypothetical protein